MKDLQNMLDNIPVKDLHSLIVNLQKRLDDKNNVIKNLYEKIKHIQEAFNTLTENDEMMYESIKELEMIFNASDDYIVVLDEYNKIKRANLLFCGLVGLSHDEVIGTRFSEYFGTDTEASKIDSISTSKDVFMETIFYSTVFRRMFLMKSRRLQDDLYPLVYLHITRDITKENEC